MNTFVKYVNYLLLQWTPSTQPIKLNVATYKPTPQNAYMNNYY